MSLGNGLLFFFCHLVFVVQELLEMQADPAREAANGRTPRQMAETSGSEPIRLLLEERAAAVRRRAERDEDD